VIPNKVDKFTRLRGLLSDDELKYYLSSIKSSESSDTSKKKSLEILKTDEQTQILECLLSIKEEAN
jgi:hypothetical protein